MTTVVNIKNTKRYDVYIGRGGPYGNPFRIGYDGTRVEVISKYKEWFYKKLNDSKFRDSVLTLKDKILGCYCVPLLCHGDIIADYLNETERSIITDKQEGTISDFMQFGKGTQ